VYSLERIFYSVSALLGLIAILLFGIFFDVGDMVLAAFRAPGNFNEFNFQRSIRQARKFGIPDEVLPDGTRKPIGWSAEDPHGLRQLGERERMFARPQFSLDDGLKRTRMALAQQGFTHEGFVEMEAFYRIDRGHGGELVGVERLMARGNNMEALGRIESLLASIDPRNRRAIDEILLMKIRLMVELEAPPEDLFDAILQRIELLRQIGELEVAGYKDIPRYESHHAMVAARQQAIEEQLQRLRERRSEAYAAIQTGLAFGQFPPAMARMMKAVIERRAKAEGLPGEQVRRYIDWVDTRTKAPSPGG
jgi:hypothetical protein